MEAGIFRSGKRMVIPAPANACAAIKSRPAPTNSGPGSGKVWPANHNRRQCSRHCDRAIAVELTNQLDR
jgi:hypothetical protein